MDAVEGCAIFGRSKAPNNFKRRNDLAQVAVVSVILVTDDHQISRLVDRFVTTGIGRSIRIENNPNLLSFDQERRVPVPFDAHEPMSLLGRTGIQKRVSPASLAWRARPERDHNDRLAGWFVNSETSASMENRSLVSTPSIFSRPIDPSPLIRWVRDRLENHPTSTLFWLGTSLRVWVYLGNRPYWMDEGSLRTNLSGGPIFDFTRPLMSDQLAPFGFLIVERMLVAACGDSTYATRLFPLICGITALWLFCELAEKLLSRSGAVVAMILFAFSDDLIYYASELKPYSTDLAIGLAVTLLCFKELHAERSNRRLVLLALLAFVSPWASFSSVFLVAGCGAALVLARLRTPMERNGVARRDRRRLGGKCVSRPPGLATASP